VKIENYNELKKFMAEFRDAECARIFDVSRERIRQLRVRYKIKAPMNRPVCKLTKINEEVFLKILDMLNKHIGVEDIALKVGISGPTIRAILHKHGYNLKDFNIKRKIRPFLNADKLKKAQKMYENGSSLYRIHKELNVSQRTPYNWKRTGKLKSHNKS